MIYSFWGLHIVLQDSFYYMLAVLSIGAIIIIWLAWFVARDFIAGIVLKLGDNYQPGQQFRFDDIKGTIEEADYLQLSVRTKDETLVKIPYSKISGAVHYEAKVDDNSNKHRFEVKIVKHQPIEEIRNRIRQAVLLSNGVCINKEPQINLKTNEGKTYILELIVHTISPKYFQIVENNVRKTVESKEKEM
ncbi:mechanosensitive ion channel domain-containing protein [Calditrichota bacterium]